MTFRTGLLLLGFLASITTSVSASAQTPDGNEASQNDITAAESQARGVVSLVVRREPGVGSVADRVGALITATWQNTEVIEVPASQAEAVEALLQLIPGIESVERDAVVSTPDPEAAEAPDSSGPGRTTAPAWPACSRRISTRPGCSPVTAPAISTTWPALSGGRLVRM